jgi:RES domain-containing protein
MIFTAFDGLAYRVLTPAWAFQPHSGAGAALEGARFNRKGQHALYLSIEPETALAEYRQTEAMIQPGTLATYKVRLARVADFQHGPDEHWSSLWRKWDCEWKRLAFMEGIDPPTWSMADKVIKAGASGLLFPSTKHAGGTNLVVFVENMVDPNDSVQVHDPQGRLPRNQKSWVK